MFYEKIITGIGFYLKKESVMKNVKGLMAVVALCAMISAPVIGMGNNNQPARSSNYTNFMRQYAGREYLIITQNNLINMDWLRGAAAAVFYDGYTNDNDIAKVLWMHITPIVNSAGRFYPNQDEFKTRIWQALTRGIDELRRQGGQRAPMPSGMPSTTTPTTRGTTPQQQLQSIQEDTEIAKAFGQLRNLYSQIIQVTPEQVYYAGTLSTSFLRNSLNLILGDGARRLTMANKEFIKNSLMDIAEVLTLQILLNSKHASNAAVQNAIIQGVRRQVATYIDAQPVSR
jgi:hypothetical protein